MADFVAVIRRAVDGLSDNTPELRAKVYEKARGAVLRQLESMEPRPPEEMLRRQLDKLEAAILEVESEHAEALPLPDDAETLLPETIHPEAAAPEDTPTEAAPAEFSQGAGEPEAVSADAPPADRPYLWGNENQTGEEQPVAAEPTAFAPSYAVPQTEPEPAEPGFVEPTHLEPVEDHGDPQDAEHWQPAPVEPVSHAAQPLHLVAVDEDVYPGFPVQEPTEQYSRTGDATAAAPGTRSVWPEGGVEATATAAVEPEPWTATAHFEPEAEPAGSAFPEGMTAETAADPFSWQQSQAVVQPDELSVATPVRDEFSARRQPTVDAFALPHAVHAEPVVPELEPEPVESQEPPVEWVKMRDETPNGFAPEPITPEVEPTGTPARSEPVSTADWDNSPFTDVPLNSDRGNRASGDREPSADWAPFEDFKSFDEAGDQAAQDDISDEFPFAPTEKPARSYRIEQRRRVDFTSIGLGLLGLLLVAGSGYGAWVFRDTLSGLVTGLVSSPPTTESKTTATPAATTSASGAAASTKPASTSAPSVTPTDANKPVTPEPTETELQKFTQRLNADGSEVDVGKPTGDAGDGEGKSVAPQTVASTDPTPPPVPATGNNQAVTPAAIPVGVAQKMFLYEERVGQTSPVAVEGSVVWSLKHELSDQGKNEAIVQGAITAPQRGLSVQITLKRNLDPSLPASHLVELVFSLPKDFDGGAIESVQRVAMKQTEQDRGDPLIAVPAKITDDFHMIALNDYADARAFNLKLLQTRTWIDIPLTYRNGRRALLTMEKGNTGMQAFSQAISEWQADEPAPSTAPSTPPPTPNATGQAAPANP